MAARPGIRADKRSSSLLVRAVIFAAWAGVSLGIVACAVGLPAYARLRQANYERDRLAAEIASIEALAEAQDRMIAAVGSDEVLVQRLARSQLGLLPRSEFVAVDPASHRPGPPAVRSPAYVASPAPPPAWLTAIARRLERGPVRRGLLVLAAGALLGGIILTGPSERKISRG